MSDARAELLAAVDKLSTVAHLTEVRDGKAANDAQVLLRKLRRIAGMPAPATLRESCAALIEAEDAAVLCFHLEHPVVDEEPEGDAAGLLTDVSAIIARYVQATRDEDNALWDAGMRISSAG